MVRPVEHLADLVRPERYPRASTYDASWVLGLDMGPHPLWQLEDLLNGTDLNSSSRVLDLGAGLGATSIYLTREYGCEVVSLDLWVSEDKRRTVIEAAGVAHSVRAVTGDIRTMVLDEEVYDAVVSVDAFEYFGTDVHFLPRLLRAVKPGGLMAMSTPALRHDPYAAGIPAHVDAVFGAEAAAWHSPEWWHRHWELTGLVRDVAARWQQGGRDNWLIWERVRRREVGDTGPSRRIDMLEADVDEHIGFALVSAHKL
jgi:SAM-dependent methyltransferase